MIILDTNVVSEFLRSSPEKQVGAWLSVQDGAMVYFTTVGEAELRYGVAILSAGKRRDLISDAIESMLEEDFRDCILVWQAMHTTTMTFSNLPHQSQSQPVATILLATAAGR
uniref:Ribonuclease VapC n=1 Tax=Candidatus Nitrotoga fabula TaxID=2182327 RepID=A0A2X0QWK5_9PROT